MWVASEKSEAASNEYNSLVGALQDAERNSWAAYIFDKDVVELRSSLKADTYRPLKSAYNSYTFWKGEVERLSALIVGETAYGSLYFREDRIHGGI